MIQQGSGCSSEADDRGCFDKRVLAGERRSGVGCHLARVHKTCSTFKYCPWCFCCLFHLPPPTFDSVLRPSSNWATLHNSGTNWFVILQGQWNQNGTLATTTEGYGPNVQWGGMAWFTLNYGYDALNRLTSAGDSGWTRKFQYDEFGNMAVAYQGNSGVPLNSLTPYNNSGSYNPYNPANNRLLEATYDAAGNTKTLGSAQTFSYDAEERMTQAAVAGTTTNYGYDAEGSRIQKAVVGGATTVYVKDDFGRLAGEYSSAGMTPVCTTCYFVYDHLGSVRLITDQNANVVARHDYLPFGEEIPNGWGGRTGNQFGASSDVSQEFTGKERDAESGLDYFGARYYGSALGRFTSPDPTGLGFSDPSDPQSLNLYHYVLNNPLRFVDRDGLFCYQSSGGTVNIDNAAQSASDCAKGATWVDGTATNYWYGSDGALQVGYSNGENDAGTLSFVSPDAKSDSSGGNVQNPWGIDLNDTKKYDHYLMWPSGGKFDQFQTRLLGMHWCGPGGGGPTVSANDAACRQHDADYAKVGVSAATNIAGRGATPEQIEAMRIANKKMYDAVRANPTEFSTPFLLLWLEGGAGHIYPGTQVPPETNSGAPNWAK